MLNNMFLQVFVRMQAASRREAGQGALEYMAMVVAMVVLIYLGFQIAGVKIQEEASNFVNTVINGRGK